MSDFRTETTEYTPTRAQTVQSDVLVPLAWSFVAGLLLGVAAGIVAAWQDWAQPAKVGLCVFGVVCIGGYIIISADVRRSWWAEKTSTATPIEPPAVVAQPARVVDRPVLVNARRDRPAQAAVSFAEFVRGCDVGGTAEGRWLPMLDEAQYDAWRDALIDAGWAAWNSREHRHGWRLTAPAGDILAAMDDGGESVCEFVADLLRW